MVRRDRQVTYYFPSPLQRGEYLYAGNEKKRLSKDDVESPAGWCWKTDDNWTVDHNRAVDEKGWEYNLKVGFIQIAKGDFTCCN